MKPIKLNTIAAVAALGLAQGMMTTGTAQADTFGSGANTLTIDFVNIGNAGNAADTTGDPNPAGAVSYDYRMGTYEISRDMIIKANAASGNLGITLADMSSFGGNGTNRPATGVSWNEAARFVNWLNVSSGYSAAYKFAIQPGEGGYSANSVISLWESGDAGYNASNQYRNSNAFYVLPSENEWYKAAYFNRTNSTYSDYATGSDTAPSAVASGTSSGTAVYNQNVATGPADIANAGGLSPYGTMGQNGNVSEWSESALDGINTSAVEGRAFRGGNWRNPEGRLSSSDRGGFGPTTVDSFTGFRVASVSAIPEPSGVLVVLVAVGAGLLRWRARRSL